MSQPGSPLLAPVPADVPGAVARLGIKVERAVDGELWARCPRHLARTGRPDRHPSFSVNEDKGVFKCFSCGYQGSFTTLVADLLGLEPVAAGAWVASLGSLERTARLLRERTAPAALPPPEPTLAGYVPPPPDALAARRIDGDGAARYGLLWDGESGGFILPIRRLDGHLLGYQYKRGKFVRNRPRGLAKGQTLFGAHCFTGPVAVLVESPLDCARLWSAGIAGAVASFGADVTDRQIELLVRLADIVILALDDDEAGWLSAPTVAARLRGRVPVKYLRYPGRKVKDVGEMSDAEIGAGIDGAYSELGQRIRRL